MFIHQSYIWTQSVIFLTHSFTEKIVFGRIETTFYGNLTLIKIIEEKIERDWNQHLWVGWMFCYPPGICNCGRNQNKHWTQLPSKLIHFLQLHAFEDWCQQKTSNVSKWTDNSWPSLCIAPHVRHPCLGRDHASSSYKKPVEYLWC